MKKLLLLALIFMSLPANTDTVIKDGGREMSSNFGDCSFRAGSCHKVGY